MSTVSKQVRKLMERAVIIHNPSSVFVDESVDPDRISSGVLIHAGCRLSGSDLSIGPECVLGEEAPVTVRDAQLGSGVTLKGGFVSGATFLDGAGMGSGAHVRPGTLLEEGAGGAHTVGFKQTILLPFVTVGSLVNFCDVLMAGGTGARDHSEVGSSYVHFNYTPRGDKATASLVGDVPRGVMLDQPPVFLGGQGGLVGPTRVAFGTLVPAGAVLRQDVLEPGRLVCPAPAPGDGHSRPYAMKVYTSLDRIVVNNVCYIGNVFALKSWYLHARQVRTPEEPYAKSCFRGAVRQLDQVLKERIVHMRELVERVAESVRLLEGKAEAADPQALRRQKQFQFQGPELIDVLEHKIEDPDIHSDLRDEFLEAWQKIDCSRSHTDAIATLSIEEKAKGTAWLQSMVDSVTALWQSGS